jgi:hypothetical protein
MKVENDLLVEKGAYFGSGKPPDYLTGSPAKLQ